jgi:5'-nucleotidase
LLGVLNTFTDIAASTLLANLCTDAFRNATKVDIGLTANGMMRAAFVKGKSGVQTVYDVFAIAPLGAGVLDTTAGSTLVTGYFPGQELKNILEFMLLDNPAHPGEYFPRTSGLKIRYDMSRPKFDVVTALELGDIDRGYQAIDITGKDARLYSVTTPLYLATDLDSAVDFTCNLPFTFTGKIKKGDDRIEMRLWQMSGRASAGPYSMSATIRREVSDVSWRRVDRGGATDVNCGP